MLNLSPFPPVPPPHRYPPDVPDNHPCHPLPSLPTNDPASASPVPSPAASLRCHPDLTPILSRPLPVHLLPARHTAAPQPLPPNTFRGVTTPGRD